jgi:hypothetical protein
LVVLFPFQFTSFGQWLNLVMFLIWVYIEGED